MSLMDIWITAGVAIIASVIGGGMAGYFSIRAIQVQRDVDLAQRDSEHRRIQNRAITTLLAVRYRAAIVRRLLRAAAAEFDEANAVVNVLRWEKALNDERWRLGSMTDAIDEAIDVVGGINPFLAVQVHIGRHDYEGMTRLDLDIKGASAESFKGLISAMDTGAKGFQEVLLRCVQTLGTEVGLNPDRMEAVFGETDDSLSDDKLAEITKK